MAWKPWGAVRVDGLPQPGATVAFEHRVWEVVSVVPAPPANGDVEDRLDAMTHEVLLRARTGEDTELGVPVHGYCWWWTYPEARFPVCSCCGGPPPCQAQLANTAVETELARMRRFEQPGVCPACGGRVAEGRLAIFEQNLAVPLGPPVTFHLDDPDCRRAAEAYRARCQLSCHDRATPSG
jgi:heme/copper-type cytochrome/quinol oxidase subunit 2